MALFQCEQCPAKAYFADSLAAERRGWQDDPTVLCPVCLAEVQTKEYREHATPLDDPVVMVYNISGLADLTQIPRKTVEYRLQQINPTPAVTLNGDHSLYGEDVADLIRNYEGAKTGRKVPPKEVTNS